jgi:hypothetical protein
MNTALISDIVHTATRLQSASMIHVANTRDFLTGDSVDELAREAAAISKLAEALAFKVGQLQRGIATEVRRPKLDEYVTLGRTERPEVERLELSGMLSDSEGGEL